MSTGRAPTVPASSELASRLFFRLYQASNLLHKNGARHVARFGATTQQWAVLGALSRPLARSRGMTVKDLIAFLQLSRQNLTALLDRLGARGWIERVRDPDDGRNRLVRLTPDGDRVWAEMQAPIGEFYAAALAEFSEEDTVQLYHLLDRLLQGLAKA